MKNIIRILILISGVFLSLFNGSCNRTDFTKEIVQVDSISVQVDSVLLQLNSLDTSLIMGYIPLIKKDLKWIRDSINIDNANAAKIFIYKVKTGNKLTMTFNYDYLKAKKELEFSSKQLNDLKNDLINAAIAKQDAIKYIGDEKKALETIKGHTNKMLEQIDVLKDYPEVRKEFYLKMRNY